MTVGHHFFVASEYIAYRLRLSYSRNLPQLYADAPSVWRMILSNIIRLDGELNILRLLYIILLLV